MGIFDSDEEKYHDKASDYLKKGNFEKAIEYLDNALEINPLSVNALNDKGFALKNMGMFDEAMKYFNKALELEPNQPVTLLNKALILMDNIKDYKEAIKCYDILLKMDKEVFKKGIEYSTVQYPDILLHIWNDKGLALFNLKRYEEAISCYGEVLKIDPNNVDALNGKELAETELDNIQKFTYSNYNTPLNREMNFCPKCGTKSITGAKFCYNCGADLTQTGAVGDINTSINGDEYPHTKYAEKLLVNRKPPKGFKQSVISILDAIPKFSLIFFYVSMVSLIISFIIAFIDLQFFYIIIPIVVCALFLSLVLLFVVYFSLEILDKSY